MRQNDQIDRRSLTGLEGRSDQAFGPDSADQSICANPIMEHWVGENREAVKIQQDCGMAQPGGGQVIGIPPIWRRNEFGSENGPASLIDQPAHHARAQLIRKT